MKRLPDLVKEHSSIEPRIYRGYLAEEYDGIGQYVLVSLANSSVAAVWKARVATGDFGGHRKIPKGAIVHITSYRGQVEVFLGNRGGCLLVIVGTSGKIATSENAITWTRQDSPFGSSIIRTVEWSKELRQFIAVGDGGKLATSPNGKVWTLAGSAFTSLWGTTSIHAVAWSGDLGLWVIGGISGKLATSPDGFSWTMRDSSFGTDLVEDAKWSPELGIFVAVGSAEKIATSPDGINWTQRDSGLIGFEFQNTAISAISWSPELGLFVAGADIDNFGFGPEFRRQMTTSPDGINWTPQSLWAVLGPGNDINLESGDWSSDLGLFVFGSGNSARIVTSPSGIAGSWTQRFEGFVDSGQRIRGVCWSPCLKLFIIVGNFGQLSTSPDGINWTLQPGTTGGEWGTNAIFDVASSSL